MESIVHIKNTGCTFKLTLAISFLSFYGAKVGVAKFLNKCKLRAIMRSIAVTYIVSEI